MSTIEEIKDKMAEAKDSVEDSLEDIEAKLRERKVDLEIELDSIKDSLGEKLDDAKEEIEGFVNKIKANIKPILIGVALFAGGIFVGSLSSIL